MRVRFLALAVLTITACSKGEQKQQAKPKPERLPEPVEPVQVKPPDVYAEARFEMVERTIVDRGVKDDRVIAAMKMTPRHEFVPPDIRGRAYDDSPLPIGFDLTISQPYIVATMTEAVKVKAGDKVLEIGTGSGYQAAVLAMMGAKVYTIELHEELARRTKVVLQKLGFKDVSMKQGDGYFGWADAGPFDAIMITCATPEIPPPLLAQLKPGGRLIAPIGDDYSQELIVFTKTANDLERQSLMEVRFGLMKGEINKTR